MSKTPVFKRKALSKRGVKRIDRAALLSPPDNIDMSMFVKKETLDPPEAIPLKELHKTIDVLPPESPLKTIDIGDMFDPYTAKKISEVGARGMYEADVDLLKIEWVIKYPTLKVKDWLLHKKGYSYTQAAKLYEIGGKEDGWNEAKNHVLDKMTSSIVKRHIDQMADVQEQHIKASKIGLAKAVEMLSKLSIEPVKGKDGKLLKDATGKPVWRGFRSIDLLNCLGAVEKAQQIYRRAMGLPNEEAGLAQILDKVNVHFNQVNIQNNEVAAPVVDPVKDKMRKIAEELTHDQILEFVEFRREQRAILKLQAAEEASHGAG